RTRPSRTAAGAAERHGPDVHAGGAAGIAYQPLGQSGHPHWSRPGAVVPGDSRTDVNLHAHRPTRYPAVCRAG
ncbi:hypothetical protein COLO4_02679, partial [Corchorus olitorius]